MGRQDAKAILRREVRLTSGFEGRQRLGRAFFVVLLPPYPLITNHFFSAAAG